jgi:integrase
MPQKRGRNAISGILRKLRAVIIWGNQMEWTTNNAFHHYTIPEDIYGTPYYITIEERNAIFAADLSDSAHLAVQRDIFIFQCLIGCRVGDLMRFTKDNLVGGAIEYVPRKTKEGRPVAVRVPLNATAKEIVERYADVEGDSLLPFISEQKYNVAIKKIFARAGITRKVTIINPTTGEEERRPINEIASSHLARRTFIGNLYKKVKDPNLIGALSGHREGSKAFARYRDIDEDMRKELVDMLE